MKKLFSLVAACLLLATLAASFSTAHAQGTAFTYQGRLNDGANPASGNYDLRLAIYDAVSAGTQQGNLLTNAATAVSNGLFTVTLDFGNQFPGANRWLEIGVRTNGGGAFVPLSPRQPLTPTPYALFATVAGTANSANAVANGVITSAALANGAVTAAKLAPGAVYELSTPSGSLTNALQVGTNGLVGIGTNSPLAGLQIMGGRGILAPQLLSQQLDQMAGYTNLSGALGLAVLGDLLAVGSIFDGGFTLMNIANPQAPVLLTQIRDGTGSFTNLNSLRGVALKTNVLVLTSYSEDAVTLANVSDPANPVFLASLRDGVSGWNELAGAWGVAISGNLLAIGASQDNAVTLADISNPAAPVLKITLKDGLFGYTNLAGVTSVAINGNLLAIGSAGDNAVTLVDITDPTNPVKLAELRDGVGGFNNLATVYSVALSTNGLLAIGSFNDSAVTLVNVANPASPVKIGEWVGGVNGVDSLDGVSSVAFAGNRLVATAADDFTVTLFDISNPTNASIIAVARNGLNGFHHLENAFGVAFAGTNVAVTAYAGNSVSLIGFTPVNASLVSQGWVGIGTSQPKAPLNVVGDVLVENANLFQVNANHFELGNGTEASGFGAMALGNSTVARGLYSTAIGYASLASGDYSMALGGNNIASGESSTALGNQTTASGNGSTALGLNTFATGNSSTAMGEGSLASGYTATALGYDTTASGDYATVMGNGSHANGSSATAMGYYTSANGIFATAMGNNTFASGPYATALGYYCGATNSGSFVWADYQDNVLFTSTRTNQFSIRASGGVRLETSGAGLTLDGQPVLAGNNGGTLTNLNAATFNGLTTNAFAAATGATNYVQNQTATAQNASFRISGNATIGGNATVGGTNVTGTLVVSNKAQISGLLRSGSETGTGEAPSPAGLVIRRLNTTSPTSNAVVAIVRNASDTASTTLVRDGTAGGFQIKYPASPGLLTIACMGIDNTGAARNFYTNIANASTAGTVQIYANSQNVMHFECTFGFTFDSSSHLTQLTLSRYVNLGAFDIYWSGNLISTYNQ